MVRLFMFLLALGATEEIFEKVGKPIVQRTFEGYNSCIFAFGYARCVPRSLLLCDGTCLHVPRHVLFVTLTLSDLFAVSTMVDIPVPTRTFTAKLMMPGESGVPLIVYVFPEFVCLTPGGAQAGFGGRAHGKGYATAPLAFPSVRRGRPPFVETSTFLGSFDPLFSSDGYPPLTRRLVGPSLWVFCSQT